MRESDDEAETPSSASSPSSASNGSSSTDTGSGKKKRKLAAALSAAAPSAPKSAEKDTRSVRLSDLFLSCVWFVLFSFQDRDRTDIGITYLRQILDTLQRIEKNGVEAMKTAKVCPFLLSFHTDTRHTLSGPTQRKCAARWPSWQLEKTPRRARSARGTRAKADVCVQESDADDSGSDDEKPKKKKAAKGHAGLAAEVESAAAKGKGGKSKKGKDSGKGKGGRDSKGEPLFLPLCLLFDTLSLFADWACWCRRRVLLPSLIWESDVDAETWVWSWRWTWFWR
jgi:hypothetical protein